MGVTGLWRLVEPAGRPVPVETLENKVLAVDISIWLHQMVKGYQDAKGAPLPNAHLMGLFQRLCKLLYFRIKPVFVFDGGFPELKRETIAKRQDSKAKYHSESERLKRDLALLLSKKTAVSSLLGKQISPKKATTPNTDDDLFKLPALPQQVEESESDEEDSSGSIIDLHSIDMESESFKNLPVKEKYDLLVELKETRKMNSWGKLHELPKKSDNFSDFQLQRLLKRRKVQECMEETEKEMGNTGMSLLELESLLNEEGIETKIESLPTRRIASSNSTRILMINNVKQALAEAKQRQEAAEKLELEKKGGVATIEPAKSGKKDEMEEDIEKAIKLSLECANEADTSACTSKTDDSWTSVLSDTDYSDSEDGDGYEQPDMSSAKAYIMQYSDFTNKAIDDIVAPKHNNKPTSKISKVDKIIEELKGEKSVILDKVDLSSSDEDTEIIDEIKSDDEVTSTIDIDITDKESDSEISNITQSSVVFVEKPTTAVISLDTSTESVKDFPKDNAMTDQSIIVKQEEKESDTSDDEFEEVPDVDYKPLKPGVEITLKVDAAPEPDDIFSDVFTKPNLNKIHFFSKPNKTSITTEMFRNAIKNLDFKNISKSNVEDMHKPSTSGVNFKSPITDKSTKPNDEFSDDLEKAIALSLECVNEDADASETNKVKQVEIANKLDTAAKCVNNLDSSKSITPKGEPVDDLERAIQMSLECVKQPDTNANGTREEDKSTSAKEKSDHSVHDLEKANKMSLECENGSNNIPADTYKASDEIRVNENTSSETNLPSSKENEVTAPGNRLPLRELLSTEQLNTMAQELQAEEQELIQEKGRLDRVGRNITEQMTKEAQELLQIFGIPYIVAPMEAEAQCAFLESVNLTDGTITDDSDIWLFGGRTVYKNFFNQKKHVMQFVAERIERSFNLTREQLILLALLVGSDYTTGVAGVGPVTAMEILASFPYNKKQIINETSKQARYAQIVTGLQEFKKWVKAGKRTDNITLKKKLKNIDLTEDFPSVRVVQAYLEPNVEKSDEKFTWGDIDITILRDYAKKKFGWSQNKLDEIVKPVLKRILDRKTQRSVQDYFKKKVEYQSLEEHMSKRVKAAVQRMGPESSITGESLEEPAKPARKRKVNKTKEIVNNEVSKPGPSKAKKKTDEADVLKQHGVTVVSQIEDGKSSIEINIPKSDRFQEIIPQREKDKQCLLQNKMKAIEIFRKTKIDKKKKFTKRRVNVPKEKADLSESDSD